MPAELFTANLGQGDSPVGGDDLLLDQPGALDGEVLVAVKHLGQPGVLARGEQLRAGSGDAPDPIKRVASVSAPVKGLLLDPVADQVELGPGQGDDEEPLGPATPRRPPAFDISRFVGHAKPTGDGRRLCAHLFEDEQADAMAALGAMETPKPKAGNVIQTMALGRSLV